MLKLYFQPNPGPFTVGSSMWSEVYPGGGWEETTPEAFAQWLASRPPLPLPPAPEPEFQADWNQFALEIFSGALRNGFNSLCAQLTQANQLPLALALSTQISVIQATGHYQLFIGIWQQCLPHINISPEIGGALLQKAHECRLPNDFIAALVPEQP
jgi:hypothetical protein